MVRAQIGDVIKVKVSNPSPCTYVVTLHTQAAADYATELLNNPDSGWKLERAEKETSAVPTLLYRYQGDVFRGNLCFHCDQPRREHIAVDEHGNTDVCREQPTYAQNR